MILDEAIAHAKEVAENWKSQLVNCVSEEGRCKCKECAKEHLQLASWLEELKARREADRWISVKERVPEPYVNVLVTGTIQSEPYVSFRTENRWYGDDNLNRNWVIAWKPLPKLYESEGK